jgi:hypothetical protein
VRRPTDAIDAYTAGKYGQTLLKMGIEADIAALIPMQFAATKITEWLEAS